MIILKGKRPRSNKPAAVPSAIVKTLIQVPLVFAQKSKVTDSMPLRFLQVSGCLPSWHSTLAAVCLWVPARSGVESIGIYRTEGSPPCAYCLIVRLQQDFLKVPLLRWERDLGLRRERSAER
ncbi:MAG: hypothetical protein LH647_09955 [Leptolyngbyaceae cyanobacterium CAN_BIN12]|nr:hypothetical protein [Leptolyngbyaceae cyanobacterium CAN_BIN12]